MPSPPTEEIESHGLEGLNVAAFESRMAQEMENLIIRHGGKPQVAPSLREVPLSHNKEALSFFDTLQNRGFDIMVFMTGVGTKTLFDTLDSQYAKSRVQKAFKPLTLVARGPKPAKALMDYGLKASVTVPEPNTWRQILTTLDDYKVVKGQRVAVQEYGISNKEFLKALWDRGAKSVVSVPIYKWALPENTYPLKSLITAILKGEIEIALFTSGIQVQHVFQLAQSMGKDAQLREAFGKVAIGSIGPIASEVLQSFGLAADFEPEHPKMGHLVKAAAEQGGDLYKKKFKTAHVSIPTLQSPHTMLFDSLFMKACRKEPVPRTPLWIMRQAGRYLPGYRQIRAMVSFLELCKTPEMACEVTVTAQEVLGVDAAILFADILLISEPLGFKLEFADHEGPVIHNPFRGAPDLARLREVDVEDDLGYVVDAVRKIRARLKPNIPLIGFAGAPFTLASYLIEGGGTKDYFKTREVLGDIMVWDGLMNRLVEATANYLNAQIAAGAQAVQLFDSWVGILTPDEFQRLVLPYLKKLIKALVPGVPVIYFGLNTEPFFPWLKDTGATVFGVDWHTPLDQAWKKLGDVAVQGNLDPNILLTNPNKIKVETEKILRSVAGKPGHIFNLGHGILPQTPLDNVHALIQIVKEWKN